MIARGQITITESLEMGANILSQTISLRKDVSAYGISYKDETSGYDNTKLGVYFPYKFVPQPNTLACFRLSSDNGLEYPIEPGKTYTLSVYVKGSGQGLMLVSGIEASSQSGFKGKTITLTSEWQRLVLTFTAKSSYVSLGKTGYLELFRFEYASAGQYVYLMRAKLEEGNTATDFCISESEKKSKVEIKPDALGNKNWWIDGEDTNIKAEGQPGQNGASVAGFNDAYAANNSKTTHPADDQFTTYDAATTKDKWNISKKYLWKRSTPVLSIQGQEATSTYEVCSVYQPAVIPSFGDGEIVFKDEFGDQIPGITPIKFDVSRDESGNGTKVTIGDKTVTVADGKDGIPGDNGDSISYDILPSVTEIIRIGIRNTPAKISCRFVKTVNGTQTDVPGRYASFGFEYSIDQKQYGHEYTGELTTSALTDGVSFAIIEDNKIRAIKSVPVNKLPAISVSGNIISLNIPGESSDTKIDLDTPIANAGAAAEDAARAAEAANEAASKVKDGSSFHGGLEMMYSPITTQQLSGASDPNNRMENWQNLNVKGNYSHIKAGDTVSIFANISDGMRGIFTWKYKVKSATYTASSDTTYITHDGAVSTSREGIMGEKGLTDAEHQNLIDATSLANTKAQLADQKATAADTAATSANSAATAAGRVNITWSGTKMTVTDKTGQQHEFETKGPQGNPGLNGRDGMDASDIRPNILKNTCFFNNVMGPNGVQYSEGNGSVAFPSGSANITYEQYAVGNALVVNNLVSGSRRSIRMILSDFVNQLKPNTNYTASFLVWTDVEYSGIWASESITSGWSACNKYYAEDKGGGWKLIIANFTTNSSPRQNGSIFIGITCSSTTPYTKIKFAKLKLEEGSDATPWCKSEYDESIVPVTSSNCTFDGNTITATAASAYSISTDSYTRPCYVQFDYSTQSGPVKVSLQNDISESNINVNSAKLYSFLLQASQHTVAINEQGTITSVASKPTPFKATFRISYDGLSVRYFMDGELVHTSTVSSSNKGKPLYFVANILSQGQHIDNVEFGREQPFVSALTEMVKMASTAATDAQSAASAIDTKLTTPEQLRTLLNNATGLSFEGSGKLKVPAAGSIVITDGKGAGTSISKGGIFIASGKQGQGVDISATNICGATMTCDNSASSGGSGLLQIGTSDMRLKTVKRDIDLTTAQISAAPIFDFLFKDGIDKDEHSGTSAQYWQEILPNVVHEGADGFLRMEYAQAAMIAVVSLARRVQELEAEIKRLNDISHVNT